MKTAKVQAELAEYQPLMHKLTKLTGRVISDTHVMSKIYHTLSAESAMGLSLPKWTADVFPYGPLFDGILYDYKLKSYNDNLRRLYGGK